MVNTIRDRSAVTPLGNDAKNDFFTFGLIVSSYGIANDFLFLSLLILNLMIIKKKNYNYC